MARRQERIIMKNLKAEKPCRMALLSQGGGYDRHTAFTMAEILLSLTIIGVVAAITLPSLTGNINERTWNTQRKALYARMSQAISLMPALNGYGTISAATESASAVDTATETFLTAGLSKVLKINNICDHEHLADCGIVSLFTDMTGSQKNIPTTLYGLNTWFSYVAFGGRSYSTQNSNAAAFETQNGESIVAYYNMSCKTDYISQDILTSGGDIFGFPEENMCINFIYDLNGSKGPNTVGKDIGIMTVFNATDSVVVAPVPSSSASTGSAKWYNAAKICTDADKETRLPNIDELSAMLINKDIVNLTATQHYWSGSLYSSDRALHVNTTYGHRGSDKKEYEHSVRCVKR